MSSTDETALQQRLRERIDAAGKSPHAVSKEIGANPGYIRDLLDPAKRTRPTADKLAAIAGVLGTSVDYLLGDADSPSPVRSEVAIGDRRLPLRGVEPDRSLPLVGTGDCAALLLKTEEGATVEVERSTFDPDYHVRMIVRPPALAGVREAYAIEFRGDSMAPRYEAGDLGIVDPRRAYGAGDYVVVQLNTGDSDEVASVIVKRLVRANAAELVLEQFNPPMRFVLPRSRVQRVHRILRDVEYWT